ncbi:MAG: hypothetical protein LBS33_05815 [Streptococcaceae bacterium]|jgi:hypothetical protein|nr:hypothetical protein [Streptococcaceae bacterium]
MSSIEKLHFVIEDTNIDYHQVKNLLHYYGLTDLPTEKIELAFKNSLYKIFVIDKKSSDWLWSSNF